MSNVHTFYHVTTLKHYKSILQHGIIPQIGRRSRQLGQTKPQIYLFNDWNSCDDSISQGFGQAFDNDDELIYLAIELSIDDKALIYRPDSYESLYTHVIRDNLITLLTIN